MTHRNSWPIWAVLLMVAAATTIFLPGCSWPWCWFESADSSNNDPSSGEGEGEGEGEGSTTLCVPQSIGQPTDCNCPEGQTGFQHCAADGTYWDGCVCLVNAEGEGTAEGEGEGEGVSEGEGEGEGGIVTTECPPGFDQGVKWLCHSEGNPDCYLAPAPGEDTGQCQVICLLFSDGGTSFGPVSMDDVLAEPGFCVASSPG